MPSNPYPLHISKIHPHLYISEIVDEEDLPALNKLGITAIVNMIAEYDYNPGPAISYLHSGIIDEEYIPLYQLGQIYRFIDKHIGTGKVLVHCQMGISRSGGIITGQILRENLDWSWEQAIAYIRKVHYVDPAPEIKQSIMDFLTKSTGKKIQSDAQESFVDRLIRQQKPKKD